jgi:hypothetical protein
VPFVSPLTEYGFVEVEAASVVHAPPSTCCSRRYPVTLDPPSEMGTPQATVTCVSPAAAMTDVGTPGAPRGVTADEDEDADPVPIAFRAETRKTYEVPFVSPMTVRGFVVVEAATVVQASLPV